MTRFLLICLGGAAGTAARYLIALWAVNRYGAGFPVGTLIVNIVGSFLIGFIMQFAALSDAFSLTARLALTTGVMGGFTTYSAFNYETTQLFRGGAWSTGALNLAATLAGCLIAGLAGMGLARLLVGR